MPNTLAKKLFLSYGRVDASELAERLELDLNALIDDAQEQRFKTWRDRTELKAGRAFIDQIVNTLKGCDGVIAVMSPHSTRTRDMAVDGNDSVCLNEISYALFAAHKPIVPAMAVKCEPPFELYRLEYVDLTNWRDPAAYKHAFGKLVGSIIDALSGKVTYRRWQDRLQPWDFGAFLTTKRESFTGRGWLFAEIHERVKASKSAPLLIVGDPGIGKSALIAELVHRNPESCVLAYHCCQFNVPETLRPGRFVRTIAAMIASRHQPYEDMLDQPAYRSLLDAAACDKDPDSAFSQGVLAPLHHLPPPPGGRRLLVIDALDEALLHREDPAPVAAHAMTIVKLLASHLSEFPAWLQLVATSRNEAAVIQRLASLKPQIIDAEDARNVDDLKSYISSCLEAPALAARLQEEQKDRCAFVDDLARLARGNFLYARQALEALENGNIGASELGKLPPGLKEQYQFFFERQFESEAAWRVVEPVFSVLVAAQEPMSERDLEQTCGLSQAALRTSLKALRSYLRETGGPRWEIFHKSCIEWLTDEARHGEMYSIDPASGHRRLADGLWVQYTTDRFSLSPYTLTHLVTHLSHAARAAEPAERLRLLENLKLFVLDEGVQNQRAQDPFGVDSSLELALQTAVAGPTPACLPVAVEIALGRQAFHCVRLDAGRLFECARGGNLTTFKRELQLFPADEKWRSAALLVGAWLAKDKSLALADETRSSVRTHCVLDERVDAEFEARPAVYSPLPATGSRESVAAILQHIGEGDLERVNPSMLLDQAAPPLPNLPERGLDAEGTRYLAEFHAPELVGYTQQDRGEGTQCLRQYIAIHAANAYRVYRVGSLWEILKAVARHPEPDFIRELAPEIISAALAGKDRDVMSGLAMTLRALRVAADPSVHANNKLQALRAQLDQLAPAAENGKDPWASRRRALCALAEAAYVLGLGDAKPLVQDALNAGTGFAGFQAPAIITVCESLLICQGERVQIHQALQLARQTAQNVQDLVFCARTLSRVIAFIELLDDAKVDELELTRHIDRFAASPWSPEFSAVHIVGEQYLDRHVLYATNRLPAWLLSADSLAGLARVYQWPVENFLAANPKHSDPSQSLQSGTPVCVPDRHWMPQLAAFLAARVLCGRFSSAEKQRLMLRLVPHATGNAGDRTALSTLLCRVLLSGWPYDARTLTGMELAFERHGVADGAPTHARPGAPVKRS